MKTLYTFSMILTLFLISCKNKNVTLQQQDNTIPVKGGMVYEEDIFFPVRSSGRLSVKSEQKLGFRT